MDPLKPAEWEYDVLFGEDDDQLVQEVNAALRKGWYPIGGVACSVVPLYNEYADGTQYGTETRMRQAVVRHKTTKRAKS